VSAPGFFCFFFIFFIFCLIFCLIFFNFFKIFLISKKMSTCQVTIVPRVNASATCQFLVVLFFLFNLVPILAIFVQFSPYIRYFCSIQSLYSLFLFNLVPNFVKIELFNF